MVATDMPPILALKARVTGTRTALQLVRQTPALADVAAHIDALLYLRDTEHKTLLERQRRWYAGVLSSFYRRVAVRLKGKHSATPRSRALVWHRLSARFVLSLQYDGVDIAGILVSTSDTVGSLRRRWREWVPTALAALPHDVDADALMFSTPLQRVLKDDDVLNSVLCRLPRRATLSTPLFQGVPAVAGDP
jgi:hypothetical protein